MREDLNTSEGCRKHAKEVHKELGSKLAWCNSLGELDWMAEAWFIEQEELRHEQDTGSILEALDLHGSVVRLR